VRSPKELLQGSVKTRLVFAMGLLVLSLVVLGITGLLSLNGVIGHLDDSSEATTQRLEPIYSLEKKIFDASSQLHRSLEHPARHDQQTYTALALEAAQGFEIVANTFDSKAQRALINMAGGDWTDVWTLGNAVFSSARDGDKLGALARIQRADRKTERIRQTLNRLYVLASQDVSQGRADAHAIGERTTLLFYLCLAGGLLLAYAIVRLVVHSIFDPLGKLKEAVHHYSAGDLSYRMMLNTRDELGVAVRTLNSMAEDLERNHEKLSHRALHDPLTELPNRALFKDRVDHALARTNRYEGTIAAMFLDLDDFKSVNDTLGHSAGDSLLKEVAVRIRGCLRESDTAARLGGDEFGVIVENVGGEDDAHVVANRILEVFREPFMIEGNEILTNASLGIALPSPDGDGDQLMRSADLAMYSAKRGGKARVAFFASDMQEAALARMALENDLRRSVDRNEIVIHYQPIFSLAGNELMAVEALVRWNHPDHGLLSPADFIPVAEQTGAIVRIGKHVLDQACAQVKMWQAAYLLGSKLGLSVNLSGRQLQDPDLYGYVAAALHDSGLDPLCLTLEITESVLMEDLDSTAQTLRRLKKLGVRVAIDDFGTGYSSLTYLRRLPVDILKIDRSFVGGVSSSVEGAALTKAIIRLAMDLDLETVGEGIEEAEQVPALTSLGCEQGQGFYLARPLDEQALEAFLLASDTVATSTTDAGRR
jgi:diguanylate cyclase (GGDEF)-like protein